MFLKKIKFNNQGVTLLEMIVTLGIFVSAIIIMSTYIIQSYTASRFSIEQSDAIEYAKKGIIKISKEVREASFGDNGDFPIAEALDQSLTFYSDIDMDESVEKVRFYLNGTDLIKGVIEPSGNPPTYLPESEATTTISQYIRNNAEPTFQYYLGGNPATQTPLPMPVNPNIIKLVRIYLKININPAKAPDNYILENYIQIRNLKTNL